MYYIHFTQQASDKNNYKEQVCILIEEAGGIYISIDTCVYHATFKGEIILSPRISENYINVPSTTYVASMYIDAWYKTNS